VLQARSLVAFVRVGVDVDNRLSGWYVPGTANEIAEHSPRNAEMIA
jgi:hypothetical protein